MKGRRNGRRAGGSSNMERANNNEVEECGDPAFLCVYSFP